MIAAMRTGAEIPMKPQCAPHPAAIAAPGPGNARTGGLLRATRRRKTRRFLAWPSGRR